MFMNTWEIDNAIIRHRNHPVKGRAARILGQLRDLADRCSDGWCYWPKPSRSANRLVELLKQDDPTEADLKKALVPIKSFLTRYAKELGGRTIEFEQKDEQQRTDDFESLAGGRDKADQLARVWRDSHPLGTALDRLYGRGASREQSFMAAAKAEGFSEAQAEAFLALQRG